MMMKKVAKPMKYDLKKVQGQGISEENYLNKKTRKTFPNFCPSIKKVIE